MKKILLLLLLAAVYCLPATAQSRSNRLTRPCPGSTTPATVSIAVGGNITATPCSGGTVTINGVAISSTNSPTVLRSYLASTVTYNNTAALADTALSVNVEAGGIYYIHAVLHSTNAAVALAADFGGTSTQTNFIGTWQGVFLPAADFTQASRVTSAGTDYTSSGLDGATNVYTTFTGTMEVNAAGTFVLRAAQNAANASNTTILRGSTLTLTKLN